MQIQDVCAVRPEQGGTRERELRKTMGPGVRRSGTPELEGRISFQIPGFGVSDGRDVERSSREVEMAGM